MQIFLLAVYGYILFVGSNLVGDGTELSPRLPSLLVPMLFSLLLIAPVVLTAIDCPCCSHCYWLPMLFLLLMSLFPSLLLIAPVVVTASAPVSATAK